MVLRCYLIQHGNAEWIRWYEELALGCLRQVCYLDREGGLRPCEPARLEFVASLERYSLERKVTRLA